MNKFSCCLLTMAPFIASTASAALVTFEEVLDPLVSSQSAYDPPKDQDGYSTCCGEYLYSGDLTFAAMPSSNNIAVNSAAFIDSRSIYNFSNNGSNILSSFTNSNEPALGFLSTEYFNLYSIDLAEYGSTSLPSPLDSILVTAYRSDGNILQRTIELDNIVDGAGGQDDFQTFSFDDSWSNLQFVDLGSADGVSYQRNIFYIDNILYETSGITNSYYDEFTASVTRPPIEPPPPSSVPVPAAGWLLGSGLFSLIAVARRRKRA